MSYIRESPSGKYSRRIGFLYEFLTDNSIAQEQPLSGNYIELLDQERYITGSVHRNVKWKIYDNLPGNQQYCPIVRRTKKLESLLEINIREKMEDLQKSYSPDAFFRAARWLYNKETRSSYEIEKEKPSPERAEKFIALLMKAGTEGIGEMLQKDRLILLQNAIVDTRFAASEFRDFQNWVGESLPNYQDLIHYICPPPEILTGLMNGLEAAWLKSGDVLAGIRAAFISFGFVFIHPFEDGNGRLHRFLIHDILVRTGIVPTGLIIPVSAHMVNHLRDYDSILEKYSKPLMQRIRYTQDRTGKVTITNSQEVEGYFRYPDLTDHSIYLLETIHATLLEDIPGELDFLQRYDEAKRELQGIVDMPDRDINQMLIFLRQNKGVFPKRRREQFAKLTDDEIQKMQDAYQKIYASGE